MGDHDQYAGVSREFVFWDLNNLEAVTMTSCKYETAFGFTEEVLVIKEKQRAGMMDLDSGTERMSIIRGLFQIILINRCCRNTR